MANRPKNATVKSGPKSPKMPKDPKAVGMGAFKPGVGGKWSAKVGQRDVRKITKGGNELISTRKGRHGADVGSVERKTRNQASQDKRNAQPKAAATRNIKNIGSK